MAPQHPPDDRFLYSESTNYSGADDFSLDMNRDIDEILESLPGGDLPQISSQIFEDQFFNTVVGFGRHEGTDGTGRLPVISSLNAD